jgi:hypothetical protein
MPPKRARRQTLRLAQAQALPDGEPEAPEAPAGPTAREQFQESILAAIDSGATDADKQAIRDRLLADVLYQLAAANEIFSSLTAQFAAGGGGIRGLFGMMGGGKDG